MGSRSPDEALQQRQRGCSSLPPTTGTWMLMPWPFCFSFGQHSGDDQVNAGTRAVPSKRGHLFPFKGFGSGFIISSFGRTLRPFYQEGLSRRGGAWQAGPCLV